MTRPVFLNRSSPPVGSALLTLSLALSSLACNDEFHDFTFEVAPQRGEAALLVTAAWTARRDSDDFTTLTCDVDWGDGSPQLSLSASACERGMQTHVYGSAGVYTVAFRIGTGETNDGNNKQKVEVVAPARVVNNQPVAIDDTFDVSGVCSGGATTCDFVLDVLANDTDPDGDALSVSGVTLNHDFVTSMSSESSVIITVPNLLGTETFDFTYDVSDGLNTTSGRATVNMGVFQPKTADVELLAFSVNPTPAVAGSPVAVDYVVRDSDGDGSPSSCRITTSEGVEVIITDCLTTASASLPVLSKGTVEIAWYADDDNGQTVGMNQSIEVIDLEDMNQAPVAVDDQVSTDQDVPVVVFPLGNDSDPDGNPLTLAADQNFGPLPAGVSVRLGNDRDGQEIEVDPGPSFTGTFSFRYTVTDISFDDPGHVPLQDTATITVTVRPVGGSSETCDTTAIPDVAPLRTFSSILYNDPDRLCGNATLNLFTGLTVHPNGSIAPTPRALDNSTFRMVGAVPSTFLTAADLAALDLAFPCAAHPQGQTICPDGAPLPDGDYLVAFVLLYGPHPQDSDPSHFTYAFTFDGDNDPTNNYPGAPQNTNDYFEGTDSWYVGVQVPGQGKGLGALSGRDGVVQQVSTVSRLHYMNNALVLLVPRSELNVDNPGVRFITVKHDGSEGLNGPWSGDVQTPPGQPLFSIPFP